MAIRVDGTRNLMATYYSTLCVYGSLHTADPGTTGTSEISGGSYARQLIVWGTPVVAAPGVSVITGTATFNLPAATTAQWGGAWSAVTAGTFRDDVDISDQSTPGSIIFTFTYTQY